MSYNFNDELGQAEKEFDLGKGDRFKFQEGDNRLRILSPGRPIATHRLPGNKMQTCYGEKQGCPFHGEGATRNTDGSEQKAGVKFMMWVLDRKDGKAKLAYMPYTIVKALGALQNDEDYSFDDLPMPYDVNVKATDAGKKEVVYTIVPAPKRVALTAEEQDALEKLRPIDQIIEKQKAKAAKKDQENGEETEFGN